MERVERLTGGAGRGPGGQGRRSQARNGRRVTWETDGGPSWGKRGVVSRMAVTREAPEGAGKALLAEAVTEGVGSGACQKAAAQRAPAAPTGQNLGTLGPSRFRDCVCVLPGGRVCGTPSAGVSQTSAASHLCPVHQLTWAMQLPHVSRPWWWQCG